MSAPADQKAQCRYYLDDYLKANGGPGKWLVDLGCCVGDFMIPALEAGFTHAIGVDMNTGSLDQLWEKVATSGQWTVGLIHATISDRDDEDEQLRTIEAVVMRANPIIDLMKIDIEGAEYDAIMKGPLGWMDKVRAMHIEMHNQRDDELRQFLLDHGWHMRTGIDDWCGGWVNTRKI